jgi:hypothetical protein
MYNSDILNHLITKYGIDDVIKFCDMEREKNALLADSVDEDTTQNLTNGDLKETGGLRVVNN